MTAENIYNGTEVAGCRFSFWIPVVDVGIQAISTPISST
jgi:hypothetical protein